MLNRFFNKTIFKKNLALYWPIWAIYTLVLFCAMPAALWLEYGGFQGDRIASGGKVYALYDALDNSTYYIWLIILTAVILGMALFHYMYHSKSANMIHALPVNRLELFGTNVISGLAFLSVPQMFIFILTVLLCLCEGVTQVEYIGLWLIMMLVTDVIVFSVVTFCAMFTGNMFAVPFYVLVVNCLVFVVNYLMIVMLAIYGYGVDDDGLVDYSLIKWFSPFIRYMDEVYMANNSHDGEMQLYGIDCMLVYLIMALVLYIVAYLIYKKRQIECAGDLITVKVVKPIFRCGVSVVCGISGSLLVRAILEGCGIPMNWGVFLFVMLFIGMIFYFAADMLIKKSFHVFERENWKKCGMAGLILLISYGVLYGYAEWNENRVPKENEIISSSLTLDRRMEFGEEGSQNIIEIHEKIIKNLDYLERVDKEQVYSYKNEEMFDIRYKLEDGSYIYRFYRIPKDQGVGQEIIDMAIALEQSPELFLTGLIGNDYKDIEIFNAGQLEYGIYQYYKPTVIECAKIKRESLEAEACKSLYEAIIADAMTGDLVKYNTQYVCSEHALFELDEESQRYSITLRFQRPDLKDEYDVLTLCYGSECENILNELIRQGYVENLEQFCWEDVTTVSPDPEVYLDKVFGENYEQIDTFTNGSVTIGAMVTSDDGEARSIYGTYMLNYSKQVKTLYDAVLDDWMAGVLRKYNTVHYGFEYEDDIYKIDENVYTITMEIVMPDTGEVQVVDIFYGSDCKNILHALENLGIVESKKAICWKEIEWEIVYNEQTENYGDWLLGFESWENVEATLCYEYLPDNPVIELTDEQYKRLCEAAIKEYKEGNLDFNRAGGFWVTFQFTTEESEFTKSMDFYFENWNMHLIEVMVELGLYDF